MAAAAGAVAGEAEAAKPPEAPARANEGSPEVARVAAEAAAAAKNQGNEALKSADLPRAIERYEEAIRLVDRSIERATQEADLQNNDFVRYGGGKFAMIDTAYPEFEDYVLMDLATRDLIKHKVGRHDFDVVNKRYLRKELLAVPKDLFDLRLACLQNISLASLKIARGSKRRADYEEAVRRSDAALAMDGKSAKALMRKGQALVDIREWPNACKVLVAAMQETKGKDPEVQRLLEVVLEAKGKGKGKGKGKNAKCKGTKFGGADGLSKPDAPSHSTCQDGSCARVEEVPESEEEPPQEDSDEEVSRILREQDWKPISGEEAARIEEARAASAAAIGAVGAASSSTSSPAVAAATTRPEPSAAAPAAAPASPVAATVPRPVARARAGKEGMFSRQCLLISGFSLGAVFMLASVVLFLMPTILGIKQRRQRGAADLEL